MKVVFPERISEDAKKMFYPMLVSINIALADYLSRIATLDDRKTVKVEDLGALSQERGLLFYLCKDKKVGVKGIIMSKLEREDE